MLAYSMKKSLFLSFVLLAFQLFSQELPLRNAKPVFSHQYTYLNGDSYTFIDTNLNSLESYYEWDFTTANPFEYVRLGNIGAALNPLTYQKRTSPWDIYTFLGLEPQSQNIEELKLFYTLSPLTEARYRMGYDRGQVFSINHAQNINPFWNASIGYTRLNSIGLYDNEANQGSRFVATSNYFRPKDGLQVRSVFLQEKLSLEQNGGIQSDSLFEANEFPQRVLMPVNLSDATREHRKRSLYNDFAINFLQWPRPVKENDSIQGDTISVSPSSYLKIGHRFNYQQLKQTYRDGGAGTFYTNSYFTDGTFQDSNAFIQVDNTLYLQGNVGKESNLNVLAGVRHTYSDYSGEQFSISGHNLGVLGELRGRVKNYADVEGRLDYIITGPLRESLRLSGKGSVQLYKALKAYGGYSLNLAFPDVKTQFYRSNHFIWRNAFRKVSENVLSYGLKWGKGNGIEAKNIFLNDYVYFNEEALPQQNASLISITEIRLKQNFTFWDFLHLDNQVIYQNVLDEQNALPLPEWVSRNALYFEFAVFRKELKCLIGAEVNYFSEYNSPSYMPATGAFYVANQSSIGNYPLVNAFANFQLKKARFYFKYEHVNAGLSGYRYYAAPSHPLPDRVLRVGIDWRFFN